MQYEVSKGKAYNLHIVANALFLKDICTMYIVQEENIIISKGSW